MSHERKDDLTRRDVLKRTLVVIGAAAGVAPWLAACDGGSDSFSCMDVSGLDESQKQTRTALEYVDETPFPEKTCLNCQLWTSPNVTDQCGLCSVVAGPVHPRGYCKSWVAKQV